MERGPIAYRASVPDAARAWPTVRVIARLAPVVWVGLALGLTLGLGVGPEAARAQETGSAGSQPASSAPGAPAASPLDDLVRWEAEDAALRAARPDPARLEVLADLDRRQDGLIDSLAAALAVHGLPRALPPPPVHAWVHQAVLRGCIDAEPRFRRFLERELDPDLIHLWDPEGVWTLPAALSLHANRRSETGLQWLEAAAVPEDDRPFAAGLRLEILLAKGDTLAAGTVATRMLTDPNWPAWTKQTMRRVQVRSAMTLRDDGEVHAALAEYETDHGEDAWIAERRYEWARKQGDLATAQALLWEWGRRDPEGALARRLLHDRQVRRDLASLPPHRIELLLDIAEAQRDLDAFTELAAFPGSGTSAAARDELAERGARLAVRVRNYDALFSRVRSGEWNPQGAARPGFDLALGRAYRNTGQVDSMHAAFARAVSDPAATSSVQRTAFWEWGRETESQRDFSRAAEIYRDMLRSGAGEKTYMGFYRLGLCRYHLGDFPGAERAWSEANRHATRDWERAGAEFWLHKALLAQGRKEEARAALARAADAGNGYYTRRASSELDFRQIEDFSDDADAGYWPRMCALGRIAALDQVIPILSEYQGSRPDPGSPGDDLPAADGVSGGLGTSPDILPHALQRAAQRLRLFRQYGQSSWAAIALDELDGNGDLGDGTDRLERLEGLELPDLAARRAVRKGLDITRYRYPTPYAAAVASAVADREVAPEWVWSIMRRESFFEASVQSHAGAIGLMQFMPHTAREVGERFRLPYQPLRSPRVNLRLGAAHLAELVEETDGKWPVLLAGYNAGMHNAVRWVHPDDDLDLFIEMIGYSETRDYVKAVLEAFWIYRELLRGGTAGEP